MTSRASNDLPLPDYDDLPLGSVESRIRSLDEEGLSALVDYERAHANRAPVLTIMEARRQQLREGATPSEGSQDVRPEVAPPPGAGTGSDPTSTGPATSPPPHGNPAQPGKPKADRFGTP